MDYAKSHDLSKINDYTRGKKVRWLRENMAINENDHYTGCSMDVLAKKLGISKSTLSSVENDGDCKLDTIYEIADYFDVSIDWLCSRSKASNTDYDLNFVCDYTGLSNEAVNEFAKFKKNKELGNHNSYYGELMNLFISDGTLFTLINLMCEYRSGLDDQIDAMNMNTNTYEYRYELAKQNKLQISQLVEEQDYFSPIEDMNRENIVQLFEIQELPKTFIKDYCKDSKDEYDKICAAYEKLMEKCRILNQQNKEAKPLRDWQLENFNLKKAGESYGDDQEEE